MVHPNIRKLVLDYYSNLMKVDFVVSLFTECDFHKAIVKDNELVIDDPVEKIYHLSTDNTLYVGKIVADNNNPKSLYYISKKSQDKIEVQPLLEITKDISLPLIPSQHEKLVIKKDDNIPTITQDITTTYGKFILNVFLVIDPFNIDGNNKISHLVPYHNESPLSLKKLKNEYKSLLLKKEIYPDIVHKFFINLDFLQTYSDIFVPSLHEDMLTVHPNVIKRRDELFKKYKDKLNDPETMLKIENELIELDKKYLLEKNPDFKILLSSKTFNVHRKLMFLTYGMVPSFGDETPGYNFIKSNLDDGMQIDDMPLIFNECRRGLYSRGVDTALGGAITKDIVRLLQDTEITEEDCKTKRYLSYYVTENNKENILYRYILDNNGKSILLTENNIDQYIGKTIKLRSPMTCETKNGLCYKCCDYLWEIKRMKVISTIPVAISSTLMMLSMKSMHGTKVSHYEIENLDEFLSS